MGRRGGMPPQGLRRVVTRSQTRVDRLSALPNDLRLLILGRLGCTRAAARTSILSRQWRGLWAELHEVCFRDLTPNAIHDAIDQRLSDPSAPSVSALSIHFSSSRRFQGLHVAFVCSMLRAAASLAPQKLAFTIPKFSLDYGVEVDLPRFDSATSVELDVPWALFVLPPVTELPVLETLSLSSCAIVNLSTLVSRCPLLRVLSMTSPPSAIDKVEVHSASLQELTVTTFHQSTIDIVAPALKKLVLSCEAGLDLRLSIVAPMVEELSLRCWYYPFCVQLGAIWCVSLLDIRPVERKEQRRLTVGEGSHTCLHGHQPPPRAHILSLHILVSTVYVSPRKFTEEMEKLPVTVFSVLELKIGTGGHVFGPMVLYLLGICTAAQRLDMVILQRLVGKKKSCVKNCPCEDHNKNWRGQTISLPNLTEVEIKGFSGGYDEVFLLRRLFRCAPMLQRMTVKFFDGVSSYNKWQNIILDTFQEYPSVNSSVCIR